MAVEILPGLWGEDLRHQLPVNDEQHSPDGKDPILGLAVHYEGSKTATGSSVWQIANYHVKTQGWAHVGYHFVVDRAGTVYWVLDLGKRGFHAGYTKEAGDKLELFPDRDPQYYNDRYLAVCIVGNDPTREQIEAIVKIATALGRASPDFLELQVLGHRELPGKATACPGTKMPLDGIRAEVKKRLAQKGAISDGPGTADDPRFREHGTTWREIAISVMGACDAAMAELRLCRDDLVQTEKLLQGVGVLVQERRKSAQRLVGG
jgi:hypothetical protein